MLNRIHQRNIRRIVDKLLFHHFIYDYKSPAFELSQIYGRPLEASLSPDSKDFVSLYIDFYKAYESPKSFWQWSGYAIVSACLKANVYYSHGAGRVYPNMYVMLLADSAEYRKGAPIMAARKLLTLCKSTKLFAGTASIQAILDLLSQDIAVKGMPAPHKGGACLITADELASFFVSDPRLIPLLTDMWEPRVGDDIFKYSLRSGSIEIKDLCPSLLAASNETFLREVYDSRAVYGGLLGRTYMIKPDETREPNSLMFNKAEDYDIKPLVTAVHKIMTLRGVATFDDEAARYYNDWYNELYRKYKTHPDRTGVLQRMHTNVLKLCIVVAASNYTLKITKEMTMSAIFEVGQLKQNYELYVMSSGKSDLASIGSKFLAAMWANENRMVSRKEFLGKNWIDVQAEDFDKLLETLKQGEMVTTEVVGVEIHYKMTQKTINIMEKKS